MKLPVISKDIFFLTFNNSIRKIIVLCQLYNQGSTQQTIYCFYSSILLIRLFNSLSYLMGIHMSYGFMKEN